SSPNRLHRWRARVLLVRPSAHQTDEVVEQNVVEQEFASSSTPDLLTMRSFNVTVGGRISGVDVQAGDMISVTLARVAASGDEDPYPVKLFHLSVTYTLVQDYAGPGACLGRVGEIIEDVRELFNDEGGGFLENDGLIVDWINRCQAEIAKIGYWRTTAVLDLMSGSGSYDLLTALPDAIDVRGVRLAATGEPLTRVYSFGELMELKSAEPAPAQPQYYLVESNTLHILPVPLLSAASGLSVEYAYLPDSLGCESGYTPPLPRAYDTLYVNYCLSRAFKRDRHAPGAEEKRQIYEDLFRTELAGLVQSSPAWKTCSGRVGTIIQEVRDLFRDETGGTLDDELLILRWINRCLAEIARSGYWRTAGTIDLLAGTAAYDLSSRLSGFVDLHSVEWTGGGQRGPLTCVSNRGRFDLIAAAEASGPRPSHYFVGSNTLYVTPVPTVPVSGGLTVRYSYQPAEVGCRSGFTPPIPRTYDPALAAYCLAQAFRRSTAPGAPAKTLEYQTIYERSKAELVHQGEPPIITLRSYRS
ncbi:MAG: hypothetical protein LDL33_11845, partial [Desulfomonile sp.]|nr:hypothetical protein [Desulfomonile sp.]